jgi:hypothetical protein
MIFRCDHCGETFQRPPSLRHFPRHFCSRRCYGLWRRDFFRSRDAFSVAVLVSEPRADALVELPGIMRAVAKTLPGLRVMTVVTDAAGN